MDGEDRRAQSRMAIPIAELIGDTVPLNRWGRTLCGTCTLHPDGDATRAAHSSCQKAVTVARAAMDAARSDADRHAEAEREAIGTHRDAEAQARGTADLMAAARKVLDRVATDLDARLSPRLDWRNDPSPVATIDCLVAEWRSRAGYPSSTAAAALDADS